MRLALAAILLAACNQDSKDTAPPPDTEPEDTAPVVDSDPIDTSDTTPVPPDRDTGVVFVRMNEGSATVRMEGGFLGNDATVFRWRAKDGSLSGPRCMYAHDLINWSNDPERFGVADPLGDHHYEEDPFVPDTDYCVGCTFSFTVTWKNEREVDQLPWDTDPPDTDAPEGDGPWLSCENLRDVAGLPAPDPEANGFIGYGFNPELGDAADPGSGALMLWDMFNGAWVPLTYDAHFSAGTLTWQASVQSYLVTY